MAANVKPIFSRTPDIQGHEAVLTANTTKDLTSGTIYQVFSADATEGGRVDKLVVMAKGTNIATVMRIWLNNGGSTGTASNNKMYKDVTMPATTVSETAELGATEIPMDLPLPASWKIYVTVGTGVAAGFHVTAVGGKY